MADLSRIAALLDTRRPGHSLPQALYLDPEVFAFDLEAVHGRSWLMVGFEAEVARPGAWMAVDVGPWPVVVTRDRTGRLYAFHNTCRHRGAQVCAGKGTSARLTCPYHRWVYELSGELVHAARMPADFDPAEHALKPVHVEAMGGCLYVCLADDPPDFSDFRAKLEPLVAPHRLGEGKVAFESVLVEKANWKLVMENARECYHCATSHPELALSFPVGVSAHFDYGEEAARVEAFGTRMAAAGLQVGPVEGDWWQAVRFPLNEGVVAMTLDGRPSVAKPMVEAGGGDIGSLRWALDPHGFCHASADSVFFFSVIPVGPMETVVLSKWLVHQDAVEGVDYDLERLTALWTATNLQDRELAENNQRGVRSPGYTPGPYSQEAEALTIRFVDWYCRKARAYIEAETAGAAPRLERARG